MSEQHTPTPEHVSGEVGVAILKGRNFNIKLAIEAKAMIMVNAATGKDILVWLSEMIPDGEMPNRVKFAEIIHLLQIGSSYSLEQIVSEFFVGDEFFGPEFQDHFLAILEEITGRKFRDILNSLPEPEGEAGKKS